MIAVLIKVHATGGAYATQLLDRKRGTSVESAEAAARHLGEKVFGAAVKNVEPMARQPGDPLSVTWWRITVDAVEATA